MRKFAFICIWLLLAAVLSAAHAVPAATGGDGPAVKIIYFWGDG
jgi:hypothetical protein